MSQRYVGDPKKAPSNWRKHRVQFEEAVTAFADPLALIVDDLEYSERSHLIGMSGRDRVLLTTYVEQDGETTRIISAREATLKERRHYEEGE